MQLDIKIDKNPPVVGDGRGFQYRIRCHSDMLTKLTRPLPGSILPVSNAMEPTTGAARSLPAPSRCRSLRPSRCANL